MRAARRQGRFARTDQEETMARPPAKQFPLPPPAVTGAVKAVRSRNHVQSFNAALDAALKQIDWPRGEGFTAEVQLRAVVSRYNPGAIDQYRVTIVPTGPAGG
jgi:hypothetical protein